MRSESRCDCQCVMSQCVCVRVCVCDLLFHGGYVLKNVRHLYTENLVSGFFEEIFFFLSFLRKQKGNKKKSSASWRNKRRQTTRNHNYSKNNNRNGFNRTTCKRTCVEILIPACSECLCCVVVCVCVVSVFTCVQSAAWRWSDLRYWWQPDMQHEIRTEGEDCGDSHRRTITLNHVYCVRLQ